jgi:autotransporter passenger strand-loop-strand repeat protein
MFAAKYEPAASRGDKSMTVITVPPNQNGFVIHPGDRLEVNTGGVATNTTVQGEAVLDIRGGVTNGTTVHWGGEENVYDSGVANGTTLHRVGVLLRRSVERHDGDRRLPENRVWRSLESYDRLQ